MSSFNLVFVQPIFSANAACVTPYGSRNSSSNFSPGWNGFLGCLAIAHPPSLIVNNLDIECVFILPLEYHSRLIISPDRVEPLPTSFETFQPIFGQYSQVPQLRRIMQIKQFSPRCPTRLGGKSPRGLCSLIIEQILRKSISEGLNHVPVLSEDDNLARKCFSCFDQDLSGFGAEGALRSRNGRSPGLLARGSNTLRKMLYHVLVQSGL